MTHQHFDTSQTFGFLGGLLAAIFKPLFALQLGQGLALTIVNAMVGATVAYFTTKALHHFPNWYATQNFTVRFKNAILHRKSTFAGVGFVATALYLVLQAKATFSEIWPLLMIGLGLLGYAPKNAVPVLILAVLTGACSPRQRMDRLLRNHSELMAVQDTITYKDTITVKGVVSDTVFNLKTLRTKDTIFVKHDRLTQRFYYTNDTVRLWGECAADTIFLTKNIPVNRVAAPLPRDKLSWGGLAIHGNISIIILSAIIILSIIIGIVRKMKSKILL